MFALDYILSAGSYYVQCDGIEKISVLWRVGKLAAVCIVSNKYLSSYLKFFFVVVIHFLQPLISWLKIGIYTNLCPVVPFSSCLDHSAHL